MWHHKYLCVTEAEVSSGSFFRVLLTVMVQMSLETIILEHAAGGLVESWAAEPWSKGERHPFPSTVNIAAALLGILAQENSNCGKQANGFQALMSCFSFLYGLKLCIVIFHPAEETSCILQSQQAMYETECLAINSPLNCYNGKRNDKSFQKLWSECLETSESLTKPPILPRKRRRPQRYEEVASSTHCFESVKDFYRQHYYKALDAVSICSTKQIRREPCDVLDSSASSSTAERSFSALRRLKTFLRSTMTQSCLNHLLLLDIYKNKCDKLNVEHVVVEFIEKNDLRRSYFGTRSSFSHRLSLMKPHPQTIESEMYAPPRKILIRRPWVESFEIVSSLCRLVELGFKQLIPETYFSDVGASSIGARTLGHINSSLRRVR
ncbi:hypothetical protein PR048_011241 [Dryococelus australis]|uniref:HAT C-terminal dimerisation domain-containing protein n=1 Tax=Dryococelus australis TaxID=614101 RepID=A0ABQ9HL04_9NEOP|nr:hypothetical protein PR048_011241 [Dryococelus australis]